PRSELESSGGFSRKENRDAAIGQHPGHFVSRVADGRRIKNHPAWRRRSSAADPKSGPTRIVSRKESRCGLDGGTMVVSIRTGSHKSSRRRGSELFSHRKRRGRWWRNSCKIRCAPVSSRPRPIFRNYLRHPNVAPRRAEGSAPCETRGRPRFEMVSAKATNDPRAG